MDFIEHLDSIEDLPTLPTTLTKILSITGRDDTTAADLGRVVAADQALAAKILRLANSAFFGLHRNVEDIDRAVALLGFFEVRNLAISVSVFDSVYLPTAGGGMFNRARFWEHSYGVAYIARELARLTKKGAANAFAAGLLHDVGKLILDRYFAEAFREIVTLIRAEGISFTAAEEKLGQTVHAVVGAHVLDRWNLPAELVMAVNGHHDPDPKDQLAPTVYLANRLAHVVGFSFDENEDPENLDDVLTDPITVELHEAGQLPPADRLAELVEQIDDEAESLSAAAAMLQ